MCQQLGKKLGTLTRVIALMAIILPLSFACSSEGEEGAEAYTLTMAVDGSGTIDPAMGDHVYAGNSEVHITATPSTGSMFVKWIGDVADPNSAGTTVTMNGDKTVTANFAEITPVPIPSPGTEWVYDVIYEDETSEWTVTVTGEETVDIVACYITNFTYSKPLERIMDGMAVTITGITMWMNKTTLDGMRQEVTAIVSGAPKTVYLFPTYTGDHGAPLSVGKAWSLEETGTLTSLENPLFIKTYYVEVVAQEEVTVPAGTFNCYKIEYGVDGQLQWTEWWSSDVCGTVKIIMSETLDGVQISELASYTPG